MSTDTSRNAVINLRLHAQARELIDRAAAALGKSRTEFMVEAARREAESVLLDRCYFTLDEKAFAAFAAALDRPPADNPRLRRLLRTPAPWD
ncbi:DUF1778 domain-containing protein [Pseudorhodoplanes sp.]|uniref:type II toxin-antitoxin system TacA family antitoxin n=1 Tax=Pseudorhodoplanes sp. TaxID=1934341 RepID=UPI003D0BDCE9